MTNRLLRLRADDDVAVALIALPAGAVVELGDNQLTVVNDIPAGHKVAVRAVAAGADVIKYGHAIGQATRPIEVGDHVHTHNLAFVDVAVASDVRRAAPAPVEVPADLPRTFEGYPRPDGRPGSRNYVAIVTSVNCAASTARLIARHFEDRLAAWPNVDGVITMIHTSGCAFVAESPGGQQFHRTLVNTALHPNVGAILVLGLGCETIIPADLAAELAAAGDRPVECLTIQDSGGVRATVPLGIAAVERLLTLANQTARQTTDVAGLTLCVKCGGSDGYSGITANPALGHAADLLVALGGRVVSGETPEMFGAEQTLMERAVSDSVAQAVADRMTWWKAYAASGQGTMDNNPSPGNREGGITTIVEKSLGAVVKSGTSPLQAVIDYAQPITAPGLTYMDTPGFDPVCVTGMIAGGATVVVFTTGRGSVFGSRPAPSLKVATNQTLYDRQGPDMDINAGVIATGQASLAEVGEVIFRAIVDLASGQPSASELLGAGDDEFIPWPMGVTM